MDGAVTAGEISSCVGKQALPTAALAHAVLRRSMRRGKRGARRIRQAYRCRHCGFWHLGAPRND